MDAVIPAEGQSCTIDYAVRSDGSMPAKDFVGGLDGADMRKLAALFQWLADKGKIANEEKFKHEQGPIWAFKSGQLRIPCFRDRDYWYLTHGFRKKKDRWPKGELERAKRIMGEHLQREARR